MNRNLPVLAPVAAAFLFLPQLLLARVGGLAATDRAAEPGSTILLLPLLAAAVVGQVVVQVFATLLSLGAARPTVGATLAASFALVPRGLMVSFVQSLPLLPPAVLLASGGTAGTIMGLPLLAIGLWVLVRLLPAFPVMAVEGAGVVEAVERSWRLTAGRTGGLAGSLALLLLGFLLLLLVTLAATGILASLVGALTGPAREGWGLARWLEASVQCALSAALAVVLSVFVAMLYGRLRAAAGS
ncbi:MAG: hypothetical protein NZM40_00275 [Sphingomonadaceae bacterium]|uniref:hypothetical protein n=1 Tax=Thermaurantiacus sp. TaxID=2820283 RepID=UPI00298EF69D|nr:hypothetical protein [Thermaurantiacus sp.]MCS6985877.1 hypothetical protein [Sphingomonadaceae bacterium]MDW8413854.1 hypothetical protein [Thermaurantiacus sp.]